jgi:hypothetical protein
MKTFLFLFVLLSFQVSFAELSDAEVLCSNIKGETIHNQYFRVEKDSVKIFETPGGFAFYGQALISRAGRTGMFSHALCGADLESEGETVLVTCAPGSQIRFLNKVLPTTRAGCR